MVDDEMELLSPEEWINRARSKSVRKKRALMVRYWTQGNKFSGPSEGIRQIVQNGGLYKSFNNAVELLETRGLAPNTLAQWRSGYKDFIRSCVGTLDEARFDAIVKQYQGYTVTEKLCPRPEEFRELLLKGNAREKALVCFLGVTGMRIMEALSRKRSDIEFGYKVSDRIKVPARVRIDAGSTKKRYLRYAFLSREAVKLLKDYWGESRKSQWVFPSMWTRADDLDTPSDYFNVRKQVKTLFERVGLKPKQAGQTYSLHSFRSFAQMIMRRSGFSDTWNQLIVGHRNLETRSYKGNWDEIALAWMERVESHANFLRPEEEVEQTLAEAKKVREEVRNMLRDAVEKGHAVALAAPVGAGLRPKPVEPPTPGRETVRFENHQWFYLRCIQGRDLDGALAQGFDFVQGLSQPDPRTSQYLLRMPKPQLSS